MQLFGLYINALFSNKPVSADLMSVLLGVGEDKSLVRIIFRNINHLGSTDYTVIKLHYLIIIDRSHEVRSGAFTVGSPTCK